MTRHSFQAEKRKVKKKLTKQTPTTAIISRASLLGSGWLCITRFARQRPDETHLQTLQARHCSESSEIYSYEKLRFWFSIKNLKQLTALLTEKKCLGFNCRTRFIVAILNKTLHNNAVPVFLFRSHLLAGYPVLILIGTVCRGMFEFFSEKGRGPPTSWNGLMHDHSQTTAQKHLTLPHLFNTKKP